MPKNKPTSFDPTNPEYASLSVDDVKRLANVEFDTMRLCNKFISPFVTLTFIIVSILCSMWLITHTTVGRQHSYVVTFLVAIIVLFTIRPITLGLIRALIEIGAESKSHEEITVKHARFMHDRAGQAFLENMYETAHAQYNEPSAGRVFKINTRGYDCGDMYLIIYRDPTERIGARIATSMVPGSLGIAMYKGHDIIDSASNGGVSSMGLLYRRASDNGLDMSAVAFDKLVSGDYKGAALIWNPVFALQITGQPYHNGDKVIVGSVTISADKKSLYVIYPDAIADDLIGAHINIDDFIVISSRPMDDLRTPDERNW